MTTGPIPLHLPAATDRVQATPRRRHALPYPGMHREVVRLLRDVKRRGDARWATKQAHRRQLAVDARRRAAGAS